MMTTNYTARYTATAPAAGTPAAPTDTEPDSGLLADPAGALLPATQPPRAAPDAPLSAIMASAMLQMLRAMNHWELAEVCQAVGVPEGAREATDRISFTKSIGTGVGRKSRTERRFTTASITVEPG